MLRDGKQARVVLVPLVKQDIESPFEARNDREARRTVPSYGLTADLAQHLPTPTDRLTKTLRSQATDQFVLISVRRHLVARLRDIAHHARLSFSQPTQHEEGAPDSPCLQELQEPANDRRRSTLEVVPI